MIFKSSTYHRSALLLILFLNAANAYNQISNDSLKLTVNAVVCDQNTKSPLPYATVYNKRSLSGTITNEEGLFSLENLLEGDALIISFIGYDKTTVKVGAHQIDTVYLRPGKELLDEVIVLADDAFLYKLVNGIQKTKSITSKSAKTYFSLESFANSHQVELVEAYYNGTYIGYNIDELKMKSGRIGLNSFEQRVFVSLETSRAIVMHKLLKDNSYFPGSPLECNKRILRKRFSLHLSSKFKDDKNQTVYVINYSPREHSTNLFSGKMWIDSASNNLQKITYAIHNASTHPFITYFDLNQIDLEITKTFQTIDNEMYPQSVDFSYELKYNRRVQELTIGFDSTLNVKTKAILYAYAYNDEFTLPHFDFAEGSDGDYRKISAIPYNSFFWNKCADFRLNADRELNEMFFRKHAMLTSKKLFTERFQLNKDDNGFFESPYRYWSKKRIFFKEQLTAENEDETVTAIPSTLYNLEAQILMDVNIKDDTVHVLTKTIFDPFLSFYHLPLNKESTTFINLYFDLVEIKRRELIADIYNGYKGVDDIENLFNLKRNETSQLTKRFIKEVDRCSNMKATLKWNQYVKDRLNIDNVAYFGTYSADE